LALIIEVPADWSEDMLVMLGDRLVASELPPGVSVYGGPLYECCEALERLVKQWDDV
jgi:hypothetical protein